MKSRFSEMLRYIKSLNTTTRKATRTPKTMKYDPVFHGRESLWHSLLTPDHIHNGIDVLKVGDEHHIIVGAKGYPGKLAANWLSGITDKIDEVDLNFSQFIVPIDRDEAVVSLQRHITNIETDMVMAKKQEDIIPETTTASLRSARDRMKTLTDGTESAFDISVYFSVHNPEKRKLKRGLASLKATIRGLQIVPSQLYMRGLVGYQCMMPIGIDSIGMKRHFDTTSCERTAAFPGRARIASGMSGSIIGVEYATGIPIIYDRFDRSLVNANLLLLAQSGAGKTFWISLDILHQIEMGNDVVIFDPKPDYVELVEKLGGTNIEIYEGSDTCMNPFLIGRGPADTLTSKMQELPIFLGLVVGGISDAVSSHLMTCIEVMYERKGIFTDDRDTWAVEAPMMEDLYDTLKAYVRGEIPTDIEIQNSDKVAVNTLIKDLKPFANGTYKSFFNGNTNIDLSGNLINYNISGVPEAVRDAVMYQILANTYEYMQQRERGFRSVYMDEAWTLLAANSEYIRKIVKTCRGFKMGLVVITQDLSDVTNSSAGAAIIGNSATKVILKMDAPFNSQVGQMVGLTESEYSTLTGNEKGVGYLIMGGIATRFRTPSAPIEMELIESITETNSVSEGFDTMSDFYPVKDLSPQQINILLGIKSRKFRRVSGNRLGRGTGDYMICKTVTNQSDAHYIMTHLIKAAAESTGLHAEINDYGKGFDVVVRNDNGTIIGFEVETGKNNWSDVIAKTDRLNKPSERLKAKEWYFVVPSSAKKKYGELNPNTITGGQIESLLSKFASEEINLGSDMDDQFTAN